MQARSVQPGEGGEAGGGTEKKRKREERRESDGRKARTF